MSTTTNPLASAASDASMKRRSRQVFAQLNHYQRRELRSEYRFLREAHQMAPYLAAGIIRRMAVIATWR